MPRANERILAYDVLRVFAIISVVAIHTLMPYRQLAPAGSPVRVLDDLLHYAVPLFVFLSGALLWTRPVSRRPGAYREFLARRGRLILLPYLAWFAFYLVLYLWQATDAMSALANVPILLLTGRVWYHLYFIPMLLVFYALTPIATCVIERSPEALVLGAYLVRVVAGGWIVDSLDGWGGELVAALPYYVIWHLPHMALGAWFALRLPRLPRAVRASWPLLLAVGFGLLGAESATWVSYRGLHPIAERLLYATGSATTVLGLVLLGLSVTPLLERWRAAIVAASGASFGVYFVHAFFIWLNQRVLKATDTWDLWLQPWFPIAVFATVAVVSFAFAETCARYRRTAWLVGAAGPTSESGRPGT